MWLFSSLLSFFVIVRSGDGGVGDEGGKGTKGLDCPSHLLLPRGRYTYGLCTIVVSWFERMDSGS